MSRFITLLSCLASISTAGLLKPNIIARDASSTSTNTCLPAATGPAPVAVPDTAPGFAAYPYYGQQAANAATPSNYQQVFSNLTSSVSTSGYMGYSTLNTYSTSDCAAICNQANGCNSFNIYFERDPILVPAAGCLDPNSTVFIKCVLWSGTVGASDAVNHGQYNYNFHVLIAGSNAYTKNAASSSSTLTTSVVSSTVAPVSSAASVTSSSSSSITVASTSTTSKVSSSTTSKVSSSTSTSSSTSASTSVLLKMLIPSATTSTLHARGTDVPTTKFFNNVAYQKDAANSLLSPINGSAYTYLLGNGVNGTWDAGIWADTTYYQGSGVIPYSSQTIANLTNITTFPVTNRDGAHGCIINGTSVWWFCDTTVHTFPVGVTEGTGGGLFQGFSANSIATEIGRGPLTGLPVQLQDPVGSWHNAQGWPRQAAAPLTNAEATFNKVGLAASSVRRYAIWPQGGAVPYNNYSAIMFPVINYVDLNTTMGIYQYAGNTIVNVSIDAYGQPQTTRLAPRLFNDTQPVFGQFGGHRSWGAGGVGSTDGKIYLVGPASGGLYLTRTNATTVANISTYEYWHNSTSGGYWDSNSPTLGKDQFINNGFIQWGISDAAYSSGTLVFSPYHGTFILVFQPTTGWNSIYYRYLQAPHRLTANYGTAGFTDLGALLTQYTWSTTQTLLTTPMPYSGLFSYDGGVHPEYFGADDIALGGTKMLVAWTGHGVNSSDSVYGGGYNLMTAEVNFQ